MALRKRKPTSPGRRFQTVSDFSEITKTTPEKSLLAPKPKHAAAATATAARPPATRAAATSSSTASSTSSAPRTACRPRSPRSSTTRTATAASLLLHYLRRREALHPRPQRREGRRRAAERPGLGDPARQRPAAALHPRRHHRAQRRAQARRRAARWPARAGSSVQLVAKEGDFATLRLPSTEMRRVPIDCRATVGEVGNAEAELIKIGKAGRNRWKGVRPQTRGVAMNPVDHPLGGGEGKTSGGRHPVSPWGKPEGRTRDKTKPSQKLIVRRRRTARLRGGRAHAPQPEEGPVRRRPPAEEGGRPERQRREEGHQDLVAPLHDHPRDGRSHHRRARRSQARAGVHHRVDGRAQARRVLAHPHLPVPRRPGEERARAAR